LKFVKPIHPDLKQTEAKLLSDYRTNGDLETLGRLYSGYMTLVYGLCLKYFKDEERSKDAVMQIFEQLITKLRVHDVTNFKSWLYSLSRNHCLMELRKDDKHPMDSLDDNYMESAAVLHQDTGPVREEQLSLMESCVEKLPEEQKATIRLFYLEQRCYKEVAELTGYDMNKVKSYIQNGKRNLKICMEKNRGE
jgi:RNA polymerase sigma factor (sigma-70 family)